MRILATQYTLKTKTLEIYIAGCKGNPHCKGCHNKETWDFNQGEPYGEKVIKSIKNKIDSFPNLVDNIAIFGGEPLDSDISPLLVNLSNFNLPIWIFTRYELDQVPSYVKDYCSYIKCGRYDEGLKTDDNEQYGIKLATSNQRIYKKGLDY